MNQRLLELRSELEKGRQRMLALDRERESVRETMLRISGAIQVLEELIEQQEQTFSESLTTVA